MKNDGQITHHLWWLRKFLDDHFKDKEYKDIIEEDLSEDIKKEVDMLVAHIKQNY